MQDEKVRIAGEGTEEKEKYALREQEQIDYEDKKITDLEEKTRQT